MDKEYKVKVTWQAMAQMKEIVQYISVELLSPEAADKLLDKMREAIAKLSVMPERYALIAVPCILPVIYSYLYYRKIIS